MKLVRVLGTVYVLCLLLCFSLSISAYTNLILTDSQKPIVKIDLAHNFVVTGGQSFRDADAERDF